MRHSARALAAFFLAFALAAPAGAQSWPSRPLRIIVNENAGGIADLAARVIGERLARALAQPVRVENRPSDDGVQAAARAAADGYTWFLAPSAVLVIFPYITDLVPYSPEDDFAGAAMIGSTPLVVVANPTLNVKTLPDLISLAREAPGRLAYANPGLHTQTGILGEMLRRRTDVVLMPVPYSAQSVQDTIAGRTHMTVEGVAAVATAVQRGQLRALAVSSPKRLPELKDAPTLAEAMPGLEFNAWLALVAPVGTPAAAMLRVNRDVGRMLLDPDVEQRLNLLGIYTEGTGTPEQVDAFFAGERARWRKTVRELKMEPD
jgi:tripartite-type tricarboxylate transporter receptor subunit TctC